MLAHRNVPDASRVDADLASPASLVATDQPRLTDRTSKRTIRAPRGLGKAADGRSYWRTDGGRRAGLNRRPPRWPIVRRSQGDSRALTIKTCAVLRCQASTEPD